MNTRGDNVDEEFEGQPDESLLSPEPEVIAPEIELLEDVTQLYLTEIGAKPLLTPEEELHARFDVIVTCMTLTTCGQSAAEFEPSVGASALQIVPGNCV